MSENEMVERVVRALARVRDEIRDKQPADFPGHEIDRMLARAAIEAMREPTEAMCKKAGNGYARGRGDWYVDGPADVWRAMIDAALNDRAARSSDPPG